MSFESSRAFRRYSPLYPGGPMIRVDEGMLSNPGNNFQKTKTLDELYLEMILPPSFRKESKPISDDTLSSMNSMMITGDDGMYYRRYIEMRKPGAIIIDSYNRLIHKILEEQFSSRRIYLNQARTIYSVLENISFQYPTVRIDGKYVKLYPFYCRMMGINYDATLVADFRIYAIIDGEHRLYFSAEQKVSTFPVMIGSDIDNIEIYIREQTEKLARIGTRVRTANNLDELKTIPSSYVYQLDIEIAKDISDYIEYLDGGQDLSLISEDNILSEIQDNINPDRSRDKDEILRIAKQFFNVEDYPDLSESDIDHIRSRINISLGEQEINPGGYFLQKGSYRVIPFQDKLRTHQMTVTTSNKRGQMECKMTCYSPLGTSVVKISMGTILNIQLRFLFGRKYELNVLHVIKMLDPRSDGKNYDYMKKTGRHLTDEQYNKFIHIMSLTEIGLDSYSKDNLSKLISESDPNKAYEMINNDLFPHIDFSEYYLDKSKESRVYAKLDTLCFMIAKFAKVYLGYDKIQSKDDWSVKRLVPASRTLEQLIGKLLSVYNESVRLEVQNPIYEDSLSGIINLTAWPEDGDLEIYEKYIAGDQGIYRDNPSVQRILNQQYVLENINLIWKQYSNFYTLGSGLSRSLISSKWGATKHDQTTGVVEQLNMESFSSIYSSINKTNTGINKETKSFDVRKVISNQTGIIDLEESPEGKALGLAKYLSLVCNLSEARDFKRLVDMVDMMPDLQSGYDIPFIVNGLHMGWTLPDTYDKLRSMKFSREYFDISVIHTDSIYLYTDSGRPLRPTLIMDKDQPIAMTHDETDIWKLLAIGAVEFLDPLEIDNHWNIAPSMRFVNEERMRMDEMKSRLSDEMQGISEYLSQYLDDQNLTRIMEIIDTDYSNLDKDNHSQMFDQILSMVDESRSSLDSGEYPRFDDFSPKIRQIAYLNSVISDIQRSSEYTHIELGPGYIFGSSAAISPRNDCSVGPRNTHQAGMSKQIVSIYKNPSSIPHDTTTRIYTWPSQPTFVNSAYFSLNLDKYPGGENKIMSINTSGGTNEEDAITIREGSDVHYCVAKRFTAEATYKDISSEKDSMIKFGKPSDEMKMGNVSHLNDYGLPPIGYYLRPADRGRPADAIVGMIKNSPGEEPTDDSKYCDESTTGIIDKIIVTKGKKGQPVVLIIILQFVVADKGDKFKIKYSQKGVVGKVLKIEDMPYMEDGTIPDLVFNPLGLITRMTMGLLLEITLNTFSLITGRSFCSDPFLPIDINHVTNVLKEYGFNEWNLTTLIGKGGRKLMNKVCVGPINHHMLRHIAGLKYQITNQSARIEIVTKQPVKRQGIRLGEHEFAQLLAHMAMANLDERSKLLSDMAYMPICISCDCDLEIRSEKYICPQCESDDNNAILVHTYSASVLKSIFTVMGVNMRYSYE